MVLLTGKPTIPGCGKEKPEQSTQDAAKQFQVQRAETAPQRAAEATTASPGPSVDQVRQNLDGQSVRFNEGWMILNPGDGMGIGPESVREIRIASTARAGDTISVAIQFEFVGMTLAGEKQWLKASGLLSYRVKGADYEFLKFSGVYPPAREEP